MKGSHAIQLSLTSSALLLLFLTSCSVSINRLESQGVNSKSIYVMDPICESRTQMTKDSFVVEYSALRLLDSLTNISVHCNLDPYSMGYDKSRRLFHSTAKAFLDSALVQFRASYGQSFSASHKFDVPDSFEYVLVPYIIWTRTKENFEQCLRYVTHSFGRVVPGTSTWADTYLILFDNRTGDVVYFKRRLWGIHGHYRDGIVLPFPKRIDRSFYVVSRPLLKTLRRS